MSEELLDEMMQDQAVMEKAATETEGVRAVAMLLVSQEKRVEALKKELEEAQDSLKVLKHERLPALLQGANTDRIGIPEMGVDAVLEPYYFANISAEWEESKREKAFSWLEDNGHGDMMRIEVSCNFGKDEYKEAMLLKEKLERAGYSPKLKKGIPWNTLTAWLKEQVQRKNPLPPLDLIGATIGQVVKLKVRK